MNRPKPHVTQGWRQLLLATGVLISGLCLAAEMGASGHERPSGQEASAGIKARMSDMNRPKEAGTYYEAVVPDTLDLMERAKLGINHFTSIISEEHDDEMYWRADFCPSDRWAWPGFMHFQCSPLFACQPKAMEAMAMERLMSGSRQHLEREAKMLEMMASNVGDDGIYWAPRSSDKKPWLGPEENRPCANVHGQGRMLRAMIAWYQYTGNPRWKELTDRMVDGLDRLMVVHKDGYAYFPTHGWMKEDYFRSCYLKGRGWKDTTEPANEKDGEEGSLLNHQGHIPGSLANWYVLTGNKQALRLSGELVRFLTKPKFWADWKGGEYPGVVGAEHAHWQGHFHGYINTLRAILEYAIAANDSRLKQFVRDGYEWARQAGIARIGLVGDGQGCGCGRLIGLAVKLSEAGIGDYWEDVDLYVRNHGSEMQIVPEDVTQLKQLVTEHGGQPRAPSIVPSEGYVTGTDAGVIEAAVGGFSMSYPPFKTGWALCCSPHGNMGLFYAWDGTLRYSNGVARVNLLLNRASPWMDVDSYLPYEGKVVLRNKAAREALVRMPLWVELSRVQCRVGKRIVRPAWFGRYLRIEKLRRGDMVTIEFSVQERVEQWSMPGGLLPLGGGTVHTIRFKGNTVIDISPPLCPRTWLYQDRPKKYHSSKAPMKKVTRFASPLVLQW